MTEELFYLDEGHIKITAASVGISARRWTSIKEDEIVGDNYKSTMREKHFDVLPIVSSDKMTSEYFKTDTPNKYDNISRHKISYKDVLPLETSIREVIKGFSNDNRTFYFLTYHNKITGLITLGNINCREVQVYIFAMICELEILLSEFVDKSVSADDLKEYIELKSATNNKLKKVWEHYQELVSADLENNLIEHLYFIDFFNIIKHFNLFNNLDFSKTNWEEITGINELRHLVCHPTRSILDKTNDVKKLLSRIERIEDLIFRINQWKQ
jgi:hypothetical protein